MQRLLCVEFDGTLWQLVQRRRVICKSIVFKLLSTMATARATHAHLSLLFFVSKLDISFAHALTSQCVHRLTNRFIVNAVDIDCYGIVRWWYGWRFPFRYACFSSLAAARIDSPATLVAGLRRCVATTVN
jgi:hypothetical protein